MWAKLASYGLGFGICLGLGASVRGFVASLGDHAAYWDPHALAFVVLFYATISCGISILPALGFAVVTAFIPASSITQPFRAIATARYGLALLASGGAGLVTGLIVALIRGPINYQG
jgi:hypothetical protein